MATPRSQDRDLYQIRGDTDRRGQLGRRERSATWVESQGLTTTGRDERFTRRVTLLSLLAAQIGKLPPRSITDVVVDRDLQVPMLDGAELLADRYYSPSADKQPLLLARSPYGRRGLVGFQYGQLFAERGFQVLVQSTRGAYGSGGELKPMVCEAADGQATVAWMRRQSWFPGSFGVIGASYMGFAGWALATDPPPELKALALHIVPHRWNTVAYPGGAYALETTLAWANDIVGPPLSDSIIRNLIDLYRPAGARERRLRDAFRTLPLAKAAGDLFGGKHVPYVREWLAHGPTDPFWDAYDASEALDRVNVPTYLLTGWQDIFRDQTLAQYQHLRGRGVPVELTVGPWSHFGLAEDWPLLVKESLSFLQRNLTQSDGVRKPALRVHVGGTNHWSGMESWPPDELRDEVYFLQPDAGLGTSRPVSTQPTCYRYDPMAPTPSVGGPTLAEDAGRRDNRGLESREDVLTFTTTELQQPVAIAGSPILELYFRSTARQTDFVARICDVDPQGRSYNVTDGVLRTRTDRQGGQLGHLQLTLSPVAYDFKPGNRIRLQLSSGAHPRFARNGGDDGGALGESTAMLPADQEVFHDPVHPSSLVLPVQGADHLLNPPSS